MGCSHSKADILQKSLEIKPTLSENTLKIYNRKITKEIEQILKNVKNDINYNEFCYILTELHFISNIKIEEDKNIADLVWNEIKKNNSSEKVNKNVLRNILRKLMGVDKNIEKDSILSNKFSIFRKNRISVPTFNSSNLNSTTCFEKGKLSEENSFTFTPKITALSSQLAEAVRKRMSSVSGLDISENISSSNLTASHSLADLLISNQRIVDEYF